MKLRYQSLIPVVLFGATLWAQPVEFTQALNEAGKFFEAGDFSGVVERLTPWADKYPNSAEARHGLGLAYYQQQNFAEAIRHLAVALQHEQKDSSAWRQSVEILGMAYYFNHRWTDASPLLEKATAWSPGNSTLLYTAAMSHLYNHERERARLAFARLFDVPADTPRALMLTADMMYQEQYGDDAEALYLEVRKKWPAYPDIRYKLGLIAVTKRDFGAVVEHMRAELARNPTHVMAWHYLGEALAKLEKLDEAADALQRAVWLNARSAKSYVALGQVYSEQGKFGLAESSLKRALDIEPQNYEANFVLGRLYFKTNRPELAKQQMAIAEKLRVSKPVDERR